MRNLLTIRAARATIRGVPTPPEVEGLFVKKDGFSGWEGIPSRRREQVARAAEHGEFDVAVYLPGRTVLVDGWIVASSLGMLRELSALVAGVGGDGERVRVEVDELGVTQSGMARVISAEVESGWVRAGGRFVRSFQVQFVFADPRKYGPVEVFPASGTASSVTAFHRGNFPAHPVIEIPDGGTSFSVSSPGGTFSYSGAPAGGLHRIDMRRGRVTRDGEDISNLITSSDLWAIPAGARWMHTLSRPGRVIVPETSI